MVEPCKKAIEAAQNSIDEDEDELIDLPEGVRYRNRDDGKAPASSLIENYHLQDFIQTEEDEG